MQYDTYCFISSMVLKQLNNLLDQLIVNELEEDSRFNHLIEMHEKQDQDVLYESTLDKYICTTIF